MSLIDDIKDINEAKERTRKHNEKAARIRSIELDRRREEVDRRNFLKETDALRKEVLRLAKETDYKSHGLIVTDRSEWFIKSIVGWAKNNGLGYSITYEPSGNNCDGSHEQIVIFSW
jgi:hypothetical protein